MHEEAYHSTSKDMPVSYTVSRDTVTATTRDLHDAKIIASSLVGSLEIFRSYATYRAPSGKGEETALRIAISYQ
jgi:hypothetical protein